MLGTHQMVPNQHESILLLGQHVGYLMPKGQLVLIREVAPADRKLIEVAVSQRTGNVTDAEQIKGIDNGAGE